MVDTVLPLLGPTATRIPPRPMGAAAWRIATGTETVVHLHPSLRSRALVRDTALHAVARARGRATVVQLHGWDDAVAAGLDRDPRPFLYGLGRADALLVQVAEHAEHLARWGVDPARIHRVTNPWDPRGVAPGRVAPGLAVAGPPLVLCLSRWVKEKQVTAVVEAVAALDAQLVLAGDGPERQAIVRTIGRLGVSDRVVLAGWIGPEQRRELLSRAAVLVSASPSEGFPLVVVEALASGVPVVALAAGATASLVQDAGRVVGSLAELPDAIRAVLELPPIAALERAQARIRATCAPDVVARRWTASYQAAMGVAGGRS